MSFITAKIFPFIFVDNNFSPGTSYFYNLYSVDRNGKEGGKGVQVMYFRLGQKAAYPPLTEMPVAERTDHPQFSAKSAITIPFVLSSNKTSEVFPSGAEVFAMDPTNNNWVAAETLEPGKGYFVKGTLDKVLIDGEPLADKPFELSLKRGWNVIGNPFLEPVAIEKVSVTIDKEKVPFLEAIKKGWIADYIYGREKGEWYGSSVHDDEVVLPPWRGVYLLLAKDALLNVPPP